MNKLFTFWTADRRRSRLPVGRDRRAGADRRIHKRIPVSIEVDYRADDTFLFAYITDISAMGIFVKTEQPEPVGTRLTLSFRLPQSMGGENIELDGEVIWINPPRAEEDEGRNPGMGIQFTGLTPSQREDVLKLVRTFAYLDDETNDGPLGNN